MYPGLGTPDLDVFCLLKKNNTGDQNDKVFVVFNKIYVSNSGYQGGQFIIAN